MPSARRAHPEALLDAGHLCMLTAVGPAVAGGMASLSLVQGAGGAARVRSASLKGA